MCQNHTGQVALDLNVNYLAHSVIKRRYCACTCPISKYDLHHSTTVAMAMTQLSHNLKWERVRSILAKLLGCFLLVAAILKAHGLFTDPYGQENFLSSLWLQVLTIRSGSAARPLAPQWHAPTVILVGHAQLLCHPRRHEFPPRLARPSQLWLLW
jgi:hypothetical protein